MEQIFFEKDLTDVCFNTESMDEWKEVCAELGLEKQISLVVGKKSPIPYPYINTVMKNVYSTVCPSSVDYKEYNKTNIPLAVIKQIAYSVKENHFSKIEIWYNDKHPDPVVVGYNGKWKVRNRSYDYVKEIFSTKAEAESFKKENDYYDVSFDSDGEYLIARWGDELSEFSAVKSLANEILVESISGELDRDIKIKTQKLNMVKENVRAFLNGDISRWELS